jgi:hypothetical protein
VATDVAADPLERFTDEQVASFWRDGFLIVEEGLIAPRAPRTARRTLPAAVRGRVRDRDPAGRGELGQGARSRGPDPAALQRWKSDTVIAAQVLSARIGRLAAQLMGYEGVRILQDNVLWKPPGTKAIGFHQDGSYADYLVPPEMVTCWMSLQETGRRRRADRVRPRLEPLGRLAALAGAVPRARGLAGRRPGRAAADVSELEIVPVVVKAGGGAFHHNATWHGSEPNRSGTVARMGLVSHMLPRTRASTRRTWT